MLTGQYISHKCLPDCLRFTSSATISTPNDWHHHQTDDAPEEALSSISKRSFLSKNHATHKSLYWKATLTVVSKKFSKFMGVISSPYYHDAHSYPIDFYQIRNKHIS